MAAKTIELKSGAIITRVPLNEYDERWDIDNRTLAKTFVTLDISQCSGVVIVGYDIETSVTESAEPMEKCTLFEVRKEPPFVFKIGFTVREEQQ